MERVMNGWVETSGEKKQKKKPSVQFFVWSFIFFPGRSPSVGPRRGRGWGHDGGAGRGEVKGHRCICVRLCASAGYQLLSGDGSLSRCMAALWCFMLSRYSCWETASTDARISSSSQSVRPETHRAALRTTRADTRVSCQNKLNFYLVAQGFDSMRQGLQSSSVRLHLAFACGHADH